MDFILEPGVSMSRKLMLFEDILKSGLSLRVKVTGTSMASFLMGGEILTIRKVPSSSLRIGDLIFFKTHACLPVIHRIVRKDFNNNLFAFQTKGDALQGMDDPVYEHDIIGKVCGIETTLAGGDTKLIDMEAGHRKTLNYLWAVISLGKSSLYGAVFSNRVYLSLRYSIKKIGFHVFHTRTTKGGCQ
jgi:signal peptidase I